MCARRYIGQARAYYPSQTRPDQAQGLEKLMNVTNIDEVRTPLIIGIHSTPPCIELSSEGLLCHDKPLRVALFRSFDFDSSPALQGTLNGYKWISGLTRLFHHSVRIFI